MNKIVNYVNNLFFGLPKTEENARLKDQLLDSMQSKYQEYLNQGLAEDVAFGKVAAEFGQMEELMPDYVPAETATEHPAKEPSPRLQAYMNEFQAYQKKFSLMIGLGIFFCALGVFGASFFADAARNPELASFFFFIPVCIGVALFIVSGVKYSNLKQMILSLSRQENYQAYFDYFKDSTRLLHEKRHSYTEVGGFSAMHSERSSGDDMIGRIASSIMLLALIAFLILGFLFNLWHPGWLVFPVGGIFCAILFILFNK